MPKRSLSQYLANFKVLNRTLAGIGVLIPGIYYFFKLSPPLLEESNLIISALALATIVIIYFYNPKGVKAKRHLPLLVKKAVKMLIFSLGAFLVYLILFQVCTVEDPRAEKRFQIGFGKLEWSLTEEGRLWKANNPTQTVQQWLLSAAAFRPDGPELFWKPWSIYVSGVLMIVIYMLTVLCWTSGWALLAKQKSISD